LLSCPEVELKLYTFTDFILGMRGNVSLKSMTGFARSSGSMADFSWLWELKSVNGRGLEIRCRVPNGFDAIETTARKQLKATFHRGNINLHLQLNQNSGQSVNQVNIQFLEELLELASDLVEKGKAEKPRADGLLALKGVIESSDQTEDEDQHARLEQALLASLNEAIEKLDASRAEEGAQLLKILVGQVDEISDLVQKAETSAARRPERVQERLRKQIEMILSDGVAMDEGRLEQELAVLATKADVAEELDRLRGHIETVEGLLANKQDGPIGRRLDFICQEFNREANTLCSKAGDKELTKVGLDLKVVVDRLREQTQNIE
jgi:uncharacterized protein (TIGR00255 family)